MGTSNSFVTTTGEIIPAPAKLIEFLRARLAREPFGTNFQILASGSPPRGTLPDGAVPIDLEDGARVWVLLSPFRPEPWPTGALEALVRSWCEIYVANEREVHLMEELAVDWESLQALYDLSADLQSELRPAEMLKRILGRAISNDPALRAVLLVASEGVLSPRALQNVDSCADLDCAEGLIGQCVREQRSLVLQGRDQIARAGNSSEPWRDSTSLALVPITTAARGLFGLLAVWRFDAAPGFNSYFVRLLEALGQQAALIVESDRLNRTLLESERMKQEIFIGSLIQQLLLIGAPPAASANLEVASLALPSQTVDGDFVDLFAHPDGTLDVLIGDVMGKGIPAALLGAATKTHILRALAEKALGLARGETPSPEEIVNCASDAIGSDLVTLERFVTLCYARVDPAGRRLTLVDCGHPSTLHYRAATGDVVPLRGDGLPFGVLPGERYTQIETALEPGDMLLLYSDGVTEAKNLHKDLYGEERLEATLRSCSHLSASGLLAEIQNRVMDFCGDEKLGDDFTCLALKILPERAQAESGITVLSAYSELEKVRFWASSTLDANVPGDQRDEIKLALTEAVVNVIRHGYHEEPDHAIRLRSEHDERHLVFYVEDWAGEWAMTSVPEPSFEGDRDEGFGIFIVRSIFEDVVLTRSEDGRNILRLSRSRKQERGAPDGLKHRDRE
ncbi:MAG: SpoIIE family protein phosphatase [Bryobacteraceae bacterium]|nr:SpoIIE family protein phosphatase [Bryobacteraceae bacterium]